MIAAATLIVGIVREVMSWPSYDLSVLESEKLPTIEGVVPGKHTTRKGWLTKDFQYPQSPYTSDVDAPICRTSDGRTLSMRAIAREIAWAFRKSIRRHSDPFSFRLLFAILERRAPSLLELADRPAAYEDAGRLCRWGMVIHELKSFERESELLPLARSLFETGTIDEFIIEREGVRSRVGSLAGRTRSRKAPPPEASDVKAKPKAAQLVAPPPRPALKRKPRQVRRPTDTPGQALARRRQEYLDRRVAAGISLQPEERRKRQRRKKDAPVPFPDRRLTRSAYEQVFLKLVSGGRLKIGRHIYTPVGMKGWYHAVFRREADGEERLLTIDQILKRMSDWTG